MSLTPTEQRICDLAQQIVVEQAKVNDANKALRNAKLTADATSAFAELVKIRAAEAKINTIQAEYETLRAAYVQERVNHPVLSKLFAGSKQSMNEPTQKQMDEARTFAAFDAMDETQANIHSAAAKLRDSGSIYDALALFELLCSTDDMLLTPRQKKAKYVLLAEKSKVSC